MNDLELAALAQSGDGQALALLLARHEAQMRAVALSVLGRPGPDVDDVMQRAALVALLRIESVRDLAAVGAWLRMVVRNECRSLLRGRREFPVGENLAALMSPPQHRLRSWQSEAEQAVDRLALRDWVWEAVDRLRPHLRQVLILRHFTSVTSYQQIAAACEIPVGTVRSRLNQARAEMAVLMRSTAEAAHPDIGKLTEARHREGLETLEAAERGHFAEVVAERWAPDMEFVAGPALRGGRELGLQGMEADLAMGVRQRLRRSIAARDLTIWEADLVNPPEAPDHCPPGVVWIMSLHEGRVSRIRLIHPAPDRPDQA